MSRFPRPALGLLLLAGLAAPTRAAEVDPILPAESEGVLFVNVRQILDSDLVKKYALGQIQQALKGNDAQKNLEKLGLNPLKDIDRVSGGFWGKTPDDMKSVFVVRGKFDPEKLFAAASEESKKAPEKLSIVSEGSVKVIKFVTEDGKPPMFASVADEGTIVAGNDVKLVANAFTTAQKKGKAAIRGDLAKLVTAQDERASLFVCALTTGKAELPPGVDLSQIGIDGAKLAKQLEKMSTVAMTLRMTEGVSLEIGMGMKDADAADDFAGTVDQLLTMGKAFLPIIAGQQPAMKPVADDVVKSLKSKVKGNDVSIVVSVSSDSIGRVAGGAGE
jgi:hypothetical protein